MTESEKSPNTNGSTARAMPDTSLVAFAAAMSSGDEGSAASANIGPAPKPTTPAIKDENLKFSIRGTGHMTTKPGRTVLRSLVFVSVNFVRLGVGEHHVFQALISFLASPEDGQWEKSLSEKVAVKGWLVESQPILNLKKEIIPTIRHGIACAFAPRTDQLKYDKGW